MAHFPLFAKCVLLDSLVVRHSLSFLIMLYLTNISRNNAGEYECKATNDCGNSSAGTFLIVLCK